MKISAPRIAVLGLALMAAPQLSWGAASGAEANKDYVVFLGLKVSVDDRGKMHPVVGGSERDVLMRQEGDVVTVRRRDVALVAAMEPALSRRGVVVEALTGEPVHSPATDPVAEAQSQMIAMQNIDADRMEAAEQEMLQAENSARMARFAAGSTPADSLDRGKMDAIANAASAKAATLTGQLTDVVANPQFGEFLPGADGKGARYDGFEVTFRISAPEPRSEAYGILRLVLQDAVQPTAPRQQMLKLFRLRSLDATPRKVIVRTLALPIGTQVESFAVHVYADGEELATNTSQNRVEVTASEAHQFVILRHMQRHRGATIPAQVAEELRSGASGLATEQSGVSVTLDITAEGTVSALQVVASARLPAEIESAVRAARFLPALVNGQPVASSGSFALGELFL